MAFDAKKHSNVWIKQTLEIIYVYTNDMICDINLLWYIFIITKLSLKLNIFRSINCFSLFDVCVRLGWIVLPPSVFWVPHWLAFWLDDRLGATTSVLRERVIETDANEERRKAAEVLVRKVPDDQQVYTVQHSPTPEVVLNMGRNLLCFLITFYLQTLFNYLFLLMVKGTET